MAKTTKILGRLPVARGAYSAGADYYRDNVVTDGTAAYQLIVDGPVRGVPLSDRTKWRVFSGVELAQATGTSQTSVMSQKAVSDALSAIEAVATSAQTAMNKVAGVVDTISTSDINNADVAAVGNFYRVMHNGGQIGTMITVNQDGRVFEQWLFTPCELNASGQMVYNAYPMGHYHIWHRCYAKNLVLVMEDGETIQAGHWSKWTEVAGGDMLDRIKALEDLIENSVTSIAGIEGRIDAAELSINSNTENLESNTLDIESLQSQTANNASAIGALENLTESQGSEINSLKGRMNSTEGTISSHAETLNANATSLASHQNEINSLSQRMNAAEAGISNNAEAIAAAEGRMTTAEQAMARKADSAHFQSMSEEDYEAITAKDPQTYYFIYED